MSEAEELVHVIDDDASIRNSLQVLFSSVSLQSRFYHNAEEFLDRWDPDTVGCLLLDLRMPGMSGLQLQTELAKGSRCLPIIFLTGHPNTNAAVRAMRAGAVDFLTKPVDDETLIEKVRDAIRADGDNVVRQRNYAEMCSRIDSLTPREREVLEGVVAGQSNKVIARELNISYKTVELHRGHMMEKMRVHSIAEVVQIYLSVFGRDYPFRPRATG